MQVSICKLRNSWEKPLCTLQSLGKHVVVHQILIALRTGRVTLHELLFALRHTIARIQLPLRRSHTVPAASQESSSCCEPCRCTSSKWRMLHNRPSAISSPAFQTSVSKVFSSSPGALGPPWRLRLLHGLADVGRQASDVACSNDLTAGLEFPRKTRVPHPRRLGDGVQVLADADVALAAALEDTHSCSRRGRDPRSWRNRAPLP